MNSIYALLLSNFVLAALLAVLAVVLTKVWRNPQFAHALWLLVLVKLVTPPLIYVPMPHFTFGSGENAVDAEPDGSHGLNRFAGTIATRKPMVQEPTSAESITELPESKNAAISTRVSDPSDHSTERRSDHSETLIPSGVSAARSAIQARQPTTSALTFWQLFLSHWFEWLMVLSGVGTLVLSCVAVLRHQRLLRIFAASKTPDTTLIDDSRQVARQFGLAS